MDIAELKKTIEKDKAVIGLNETLKAAGKKHIEMIIISSTCPPSVEAKLNASKVTIERIEKTSEELGILCKKSFNISVLGIKK